MLSSLTGRRRATVLRACCVTVAVDQGSVRLIDERKPLAVTV